MDTRASVFVLDSVGYIEFFKASEGQPSVVLEEISQALAGSEVAESLAGKLMEIHMESEAFPYLVNSKGSLEDLEFFQESYATDWTYTVDFTAKTVLVFGRNYGNYMLRGEIDPMKEVEQVIPERKDFVASRILGAMKTIGNNGWVVGGTK